MIVLGIDPGSKRSGWAIATDPETIAESGVAINAIERVGAVKWAQMLGVTHVCIEWVTAGGRGTKTAMGIGQARGRWLEHVAMVLGIGQGSVRLLKPNTQQWRAQTHGVTKAEGSSDEKARAFKRAARAFAGVDDPDEAEACCIALYGAAMVVGEQVA